VPGLPACPADPGPVPARPSGPRRAPADDDEVLATVLISTWSLATGRILRSDVPPDQLPEEELICFWADELNQSAAVVVLNSRAARAPEVVMEIPGKPAPQPASGQVCAMFACDIADFTGPGRNDEIQLYLRRALYDMLRDAFTGSGLPWEQCEYHDRGDGALVIIPPGAPAQATIDPLPERLAGLIRRYNRIVREPARMQLRIAVNIGPVWRDDHGIAGEDVNLLCRMLNVQKLRQALAGSATELALIVSANVYQSLVRRHPSLVDPARFQPVTTKVKQTRIRAWIYVPGGPPPQLSANRWLRCPPVPREHSGSGLLSAPTASSNANGSGSRVSTALISAMTRRVP
jgi:class 3 adenylate cyclase